MPDKIKCMVVDDEPLAIKVLKSYIDKVPFLDLSVETQSPFEAMEIIKEGAIDLVFLDIDMPELTGIELISSIDKRPSFIFVTAYREYAADAFDLDAMDYLLKPVSFPRFLKAVNKFEKGNKQIDISSKSTQIQLRADRKTHQVSTDSILFIEGLKDYIKVHLEGGGMLLVKETMSSIEASLKSYQFIRCHKSYIIPVTRVAAFTSDFLEIHGFEIPIGRSYKEQVAQRLSDTH